MQNFIVEFKQALSPDFCQQIISKFEADKRQHQGRTGGGVDPAKKHSQDLAISQFDDWREITTQINNLIHRGLIQYARAYPHFLVGAVSTQMQDPQTGKITDIDARHIQQMPDEQLSNIINHIYQPEPINLQKYLKGKGGYPYWHSEHFPHPTDTSQRSLHRVLLWLIYLNEVEQGGETEFVYQQAKIKPTSGSLILSPCGFTHTHCGQKPISNDKYILASWIGYKPASSLYSTS